jgi:hypothetical protein
MVEQPNLVHMISSRELGIPCVINTVDGTRSPRAGDRIMFAAARARDGLVVVGQGWSRSRFCVPRTQRGNRYPGNGQQRPTTSVTVRLR